MRILSPILTLSALLWLGSAKAAEAVRCDSCSSTTKRSVAINVAKVSTYKRSETVYFFDMENRSLSGLLVEYDDELRRAITLPLFVPTSDKQVFNDFHDIWMYLLATKDRILMESSEFETIYDISNCGACARSWVYANRGVFATQLPALDAFAVEVGRVSFALGLNNSQVETTVDRDLEYEVVLTTDTSGGPMDAYCIGRLTGTGFEVDENRCYDSDGNQIPTSANQMDGERYRFTSAVNLSNFVHRMGVLNRTYTGPTGGVVGVGDIVEVECDGGNGCTGEEQGQ